MKFKTGDVVRLKVGGPRMVVDGILDDVQNSYECVWFSWGGQSASHGDFNREPLDEANLELA
jgi:uncharacterized protein YodC (DUF2158 family)